MGAVGKLIRMVESVFGTNCKAAPWRLVKDEVVLAKVTFKLLSSGTAPGTPPTIELVWMQKTEFVSSGSITLAQALTYVQANATAFAQDPVTFAGKVNFGASGYIQPNGSAFLGGGGFKVAADGGLIIGLGPPAFSVSATGVALSTQDIEISDTTKGYITKSPNGTRYRLKVDDAGNIGTEAA